MSRPIEIEFELAERWNEFIRDAVSGEDVGYICHDGKRGSSTIRVGPEYGVDVVSLPSGVTVITFFKRDGGDT